MLSPSRRLRSASQRSSGAYNPLKDGHLEEFYARRTDVRRSLADLGLITSARKVVDNSEHSMRLVDRALSVLDYEDPSALREAIISARGDRIARLVEKNAAEADAKKRHILAQYAKERMRRAEKREKQQKDANGTQNNPEH
jgi:hypothetical protein